MALDAVVIFNRLRFFLKTIGYCLKVCVCG